MGHDFFFLFIVDRCRSLNFPLVFFVINWDAFVLASVGSKAASIFADCQCSCCCVLFSLLLCVRAPEAQVLSPPSPAGLCLCFCGDW